MACESVMDRVRKKYGAVAASESNHGYYYGRGYYPGYGRGYYRPYRGW